MTGTRNQTLSGNRPVTRPSSWKRRRQRWSVGACGHRHHRPDLVWLAAGLFVVDGLLLAAAVVLDAAPVVRAGGNARTRDAARASSPKEVKSSWRSSWQPRSFSPTGASP